MTNQNITPNSHEVTEVITDTSPSRESAPTSTSRRFTLNPGLAIAAFIIVVSGVASGFALSRIVAGEPVSEAEKSQFAPTPAEDGRVEIGQTYGADSPSFTDGATGVLIEGGNNGAGTHRLIRPGGDSQTICLTSSVLDLNPFTNTEIEIKGQTFDSRECGWFIDVGQVTVKALAAEPAFDPEE